MALGAPFVVAEVRGPTVTVTYVDRVSSLINDNEDARAVPIQKGEWAYLGEFSLESGGNYSRTARSDEEFIYVLSGSAVVSVGEQRFLVGPRMSLHLPSGTDVEWTAGAERFVAVQFFAGPSSNGSYEDWGAEDDGVLWPRPRVMPRPPRTEVSAK